MFYCVEGQFNMQTAMSAITEKNKKALIIVDHDAEIGWYVSVKCDIRPEPFEDGFGATLQWVSNRMSIRGGD